MISWNPENLANTTLCTWQFSLDWHAQINPLGHVCMGLNYFLMMLEYNSALTGLIEVVGPWFICWFARPQDFIGKKHGVSKVIHKENIMGKNNITYLAIITLKWHKFVLLQESKLGNRAHYWNVKIQIIRISILKSRFSL